MLASLSYDVTSIGHVIKVLTSSSYDVTSIGDIIHHVVNPRLLSGMTSYDEASLICSARPFNRVPAAPRSGLLVAAQRALVSSLAAPRESAAQSFPITVHRLGPGVSCSSADAVAEVMMLVEAAGAAGHSLRVPALGLEAGLSQ